MTRIIPRTEIRWKFVAIRWVKCSPCKSNIIDPCWTTVLSDVFAQAPRPLKLAWRVLGAVALLACQCVLTMAQGAHLIPNTNRSSRRKALSPVGWPLPKASRRAMEEPLT